MIPRTGLFLIAGLLALIACADHANAQIVAIGASNVAGRGVSSADAWPAQLEDMLAAKGRHVHVVNAGINGDTNAGMLNRLDSAVPAGTKIVLLDRYGGRHGLDADDYATMALRRHLEDLRDIVVADAALKELGSSGAKTLSWDEMISVLDR